MQTASSLWLPNILLGLLLLPVSTTGRQQTADPTSQVDPLTAPVTLTAQGQSLQAIVQSLTPSIGPEMETSEPLQWERASVYVHGKPLRKVMRGLQILFNYNWLTDPEKPPLRRYLFVSSERERLYETDLWRQTLEQAAAPLFKLTRYLATSQEEYEQLDAKLREQHKDPDDPVLRDNLFYLARSGPRFGLRLLTTLTPEQRLVLLENGRYVLTQGEMTEQQKSLTHGLGQTIGEFRQRWGRVLPGETPEDSAALADRLGIILSVREHSVSGRIDMYSYGLSDVGGMVAASLSDTSPLEDLLPVRGNPYHYNPARKAALSSYPALERMMFPADFKLQATRYKAWRDVMAEFTKHVSLPIFSDDYSFTPDPRDRQYFRDYPDSKENLPRAVPADLTHLSLEAGLDALCDQYRYLWWYEDGMLFFRSRTWFIERQYEVPPSILALLQQHLQQNGGRYDVACLTALSALTLKQLQGINMLNVTEQRYHDRGDARSNAVWAYHYLQMIPLLDEDQKAKVLSPTGLALTEMTSQQQQAFVQMLFMTFGPEILYRAPNIRLKAEQDPASDRSINPRSIRLPVLCFTYRDGDAVIASVYVGYKPSHEDQNSQ